VEMGRQSHISVKVERNSQGTGISAVWLGGAAVEVMEGSLVIDVEE